MKGKKTEQIFSKRLGVYLIGSLAVLIVTHLILQYLNIEVFQEQNAYVYEFSNRFDFDDEASIPTWFSQALFLCIGLVAFFIRHYAKNRAERNVWLSIGLIGLVFSIDEVSTIHETVLHLFHGALLEEGTTSVQSNAWLYIAPFILLVLGLIMRKVVTTLNRQTSLLLGAGISIIVVGAIAIDIVAVGFATGSFMRSGIMAALEESLELFGTILMLFACVDYLEKRKPELFATSRLPARVAKKS